ncbi:CU044_5270 family protein [Thermomonospora amylolytica]|uniref:CU044_5270 family protein n=1 Tax=Thermomonospora amylolytica TaxID=1411117 RepID=UPI000E6D2219|nr:CU044_5270 family protein [Thermomonospora amylolytica]
MDEIDALRQVRTALAQQETPERLAERIDWRSAPSAPAAPRRSRFRVPLLSLVTATAVAAASVTVVTLASNERTPGGPGAQATVHGGNALLVAAANAEKAPDGRYWHTKRLTGRVFAVGKTAADHYKVDTGQEFETWVDRNGQGRAFMSDRPARPVTPEDERKWREAGSPMRIETPDADGVTVSLYVKPFTGRAPMSLFPEGEVYNFHGLTARQLAELPTDPKALENVLLDLKGEWRAYSKDFSQERRNEPIRALSGAERVRALSDVAGGLLGDQPVPPAVRAAAFKMLAGLPGVKVEGKGTDPLGRTGTVVSLPLETTVPLGLYSAPKQLGTYRRQWIIDPSRGTLLAIQDLVATPPKGSRELPPGDNGRPRRLTVDNQPDRFHKPGEVSMYEAYVVAEWTDSEPR